MAERNEMEALYDRLRETEAQTREQNARIEALTKSVDTMMARWDDNMAKMWRLIYILVGALLSLALGPKVAEKIVKSEAVVHMDIIPWHGETPAPMRA